MRGGWVSFGATGGHDAPFVLKGDVTSWWWFAWSSSRRRSGACTEPVERHAHEHSARIADPSPSHRSGLRLDLVRAEIWRVTQYVNSRSSSKPTRTCPAQKLEHSTACQLDPRRSGGMSSDASASSGSAFGFSSGSGRCQGSTLLAGSSSTTSAGVCTGWTGSCARAQRR